MTALATATISNLLDCACELRAQLLRDRAAVQRHLRTCGEADPMQQITGHSALQQACMDVDELITEMRSHHQNPVSTHVAPPIIEIKPISRSAPQPRMERIAC